MADPIKIQKSKNRYLKEKVDRVQITVPKGQSLGKSLNSYVVDLINADMQTND